MPNLSNQTHPIRRLAIVLLALFAVVALIDVLLATRPLMLAYVSVDSQRLLTGTGLPATWTNLLAVALTVACIAIAATALVGLVRIAPIAPYAVLAPMLVGSCVLLLGQLAIVWPVPVPKSLFIAMATLLVVGGGSLFNRSGLLTGSAGVILAAVPLLLVGVGYAFSYGELGTMQPFDRGGQMVALVMAFCMIGAPLFAVSLRRPRSPQGHNAAQLAARIQAAEARERDAQRQLVLDPMLQPRQAIGRWSSARWLWLATLLGCSAFAITVYLEASMELTRSLSDQTALNRQHGEQHAAAMAAMRSEFESERAQLLERIRTSTAIADRNARGPALPVDGRASNQSRRAESFSLRAPRSATGR